MAEQSETGASSRNPAKSQRVLACVHCQQRKIKCDRKFPCANCLKTSVQCVPSAQNPRNRRRRFPERDLLERLRHYENLLRQNSIEFEPLHPSSADKVSKAQSRGHGFDGDKSPGGRAKEEDVSSREQSSVKSETAYEPMSFWHALNDRSPDDRDDVNDDENDIDDDDDDDSDPSPDTVREAVIKKAMSRSFESKEHLLFGSRMPGFDLSTLHPGQVQIFRLWQVYLDNVNPLLKVTHTPTLQARIVDAATDVSSLSPSLEALMFSIYCISVQSLTEDECQSSFGMPKRDLLSNYQFGCQQALMSCEIFRSSDRDCLTALFLYLVSARPETDPRSLSSMVGVAMRIAQRMGINHEFANAKCSVLEAEMRRRLWWAMVLFDSRISEISDHRSSTLNPTWDCRIPLNVNDFDLRPEMKTQPAIHGTSTEALFAVVRGELAEFVRHSGFHLNFVNPVLKAISKNVQHGLIPEGGEMDALEKLVDEKYFHFCHLENPFHFMTIYSARAYIAKHRLTEHYSRCMSSTAQPTLPQRDAAFKNAMNMLEYDTELVISPLTKGYFWFVETHFPFPGYVHIVQELKKRPVGELSDKAWEVMSDNFEARSNHIDGAGNPFMKVFSRMISQAWTARQAVPTQSGEPEMLPRIILSLDQKLGRTPSNTPSNDLEHPNGSISINADDFSMFLPMNFGTPGMMPGIGEQPIVVPDARGFQEPQGQTEMEIDGGRSDWSTIDWTPTQEFRW